MKKRILAALLALGCALLVFTGCGSKKDTTPKDYTQIIHDAREAEDNDYYMIFSPAEDGKFTAQYGYSASYPADDLNDEIQNMLLPLLDLPEGSYTDLAASLSAMMVQSYGVAIVKPAEGKTQEVVDAMDAYPEPAADDGALPRGSVSDRRRRQGGHCPHRRSGHGVL